MNAIVRTPDRSLAWDLFNDIDGFWNGFGRPLRTVREDVGAFSPAVDIAETDEAYTVTADLPGISKDDIDVTVKDGVLTLNAEVRKESERPEGRLLRKERRYGKFVRSLRLGNDVDVERVKASYSDGVLRLTLPKAEAVKPKKIEVGVS